MVKGGRWERLAAEVGPTEGGGFATELCKRLLHYHLARPASSERGAADLKGYAHCRRPPLCRLKAAGWRLEAGG